MRPPTLQPKKLTMELALTGAAFLIGALCAGLMGFAIQRGATCTVAAMDEVVRKRTFTRLGSMVEASLWVLGGLLIARSFHALAQMPAGYAVTWTTILGGALLGIGAFVNGACVFGAIARLGSGEWAYVVTPIGFFAGCLIAGAIGIIPAPQKLAFGSPVLHASMWLAGVFLIAMIWRVGRALRDARAASRSGGAATGLRLALTQHVWSPRGATTVIGITFFFMLVLTGAWAYTDVLAELARGMATNLPARILLVFALLVGAMIGGWTAGRLRSTPVTLGQVGKCFVGGALMGWGSLMIPGGNDGLILVGMPLAWPYAWVAFLTMCVTIGTAQWTQKALAMQSGEQAVH